MTWAAIRTLLATPLGRWCAGFAGGLLTLALIAGANFWLRAHWIDQGINQEKAAEIARLTKAKPAIDRVNAGGAAITATTEQHAKAEADRIRVVYRDLIKEIPTYVTPEADRRCDLPIGFVRLHDQAAAGVPELSGPAVDLRDASSGIPLSAATGVIVGNYGAAYQWRDRAVACEAWAVSQADLWTKNVSTASPSP